MIHHKVAESRSLSRTTRRQGLTLMELVVVLSILAGLAAILVPMFPNILRRTHKATDTTQTSEISKSVQTYQALYLSYPDQFDLLGDGSTTDLTYLKGAGSATGPFGGFTTIQALNTADTPQVTALAALNNAGIKLVMPMTATTTTATFQATMFPYDVGANPIPITAATNVRFVNRTAAQAANPAFMQGEFNNDPLGQYVVFGVGARNSMVGQVMQDAPFAVPQDKDFTPANTYSRFGVIFKVAGNEVNVSQRARFICAVALEDDELESTEKDAIGFYQVASPPGQ
jgi:prepilin-type N-terminal cleavage/methylation domain-containing protein